MQFEVEENSTHTIQVSLEDTSGDPLSSVDSIEWWIGKPRQSEPVLDKQQVISPSASQEIVLPAEAHVCASRRDEQRFLILRVVSGMYERHRQYNYLVKNLDLVPYPSES